MAKRKKPVIQQMAFSGIHDKDLKKLVKELKSVGATDIVVSDDDGDYSEFEAGKYHVVEYKK